MTKEVFTCPHCFGKADKISEDKEYVKVKCRDCKIVLELDKVDL